MTHEPGHYDDWLKKQEGKRNWGNLTNKGKAGTLNQLSNLADLGKKAFGMSDEMRAAKSAAIANTPPVKPGGSKKGDMSVQEDWKDDTSSTSTKKVTENTSPLSDADLAYQREKERNGLA